MRYAAGATELILSAGRCARGLGHSYVGSIHILIALAEEPGSTGQLLRAVGLEPELLRQLAGVLFGTGTQDLPLPQGLTREV